MRAKGTVRPSESPIVASLITLASTFHHGRFDEEPLGDEEREDWDSTSRKFW